jgi:hypothetical protein
MDIKELEQFNKHLGAKFCDDAYQKAVAESADLVNLPIMDVYARKLLTQLGCEAVPNRILIVKMAFIHGHLAGQDYVKMLQMEEMAR